MTASLTLRVISDIVALMPDIVIKYNRFLDPIFTAWIKAQPQWSTWECPSIESVQSQIEMYKSEWAKNGAAILQGMQNGTGLTFKRNQIDVHIVSGNPRPFSSPIVMKSRYSAEEFTSILTHELIHCLYADNEDFFAKIPSFHKNPSTHNHIIVFALMTYIFTDVVKKPEYLEFPKISPSPTNQTYIDAWSNVEEIGYKNILEKIRT